MTELWLLESCTLWTEIQNVTSMFRTPEDKLKSLSRRSASIFYKGGTRLENPKKNLEEKRKKEEQNEEKSSILPTSPTILLLLLSLRFLLTKKKKGMEKKKKNCLCPFPSSPPSTSSPGLFV